MRKSETFLVFCLLALAVVLVYSNSLKAGFVYDDYAFVCNNQAIRTLTPATKFLLSPEAFSEPVSYHVFRPLAAFTFALNYALGGSDPAGYRLINILFHLLNAFLLFLMLKRIGFAELPSLMGALIFAVHPVHTEAVTWISGRGNVLFLFFFLLAYLFYAQIDGAPTPRNRLLYAGALAAYVFSLLAKEMALPLPALLFAHDLYFRHGEGERTLKSRWKGYIPFLIAAIAYVALRAHVLGRTEQVGYHGGSIFATFLVMLWAAVVYVKLLFVPVGLSLSRHFAAVHSLLDVHVISGLVLVAGLIALAIHLFRRAPLISFAIFWFAATMAPVSNIVPLNAIVADRFLYGPSIAFSIILAAAVSSLSLLRKQEKALASAALAGLFCLMMLLSVARNNDWKNPAALWLKTAESSPSSYVAFNNLAIEYMKLGRLPEAVEALQKAAELRQDLPETHVNLARCYEKMGRIDQAEAQYSLALNLGADPSIQAELQALRQQGRRNPAW